MHWPCSCACRDWPEQSVLQHEAAGDIGEVGRLLVVREKCVRMVETEGLVCDEVWFGPDFVGDSDFGVHSPRIRLRMNMLFKKNSRFQFAGFGYNTISTKL